MSRDKAKPGRPKDAYCIHPKRNSRNKLNTSLRQVCAGIKLRLRRETDPEKRKLIAEIGLEINELLLNLE